jgi:hypothetical protein
MVNIWKISTLVLAGALAIVVGQGSVRDTEACEGATPTAEEQTQVRLITALRFLDKAEREIKAAPAVRPKPRAAALQQITLAKLQVQRGLDPEAEPEPMPVPRPRPMKKPATKAVDADKTARLDVTFR